MNEYMSMSSPVVSGTWQNMNNGDVFVVRDFYMNESGEPFVSTTDGRTISATQLERYVQISDTALPQNEINALRSDFKNNQAAERNTPQVNRNNLLQGLSTEGMLPDELSLITGVGVLDDAVARPTTQPTNTNHDIIAKAFKDKVSAPDVELCWPDFPSKQITLLTEIMDIPLEDIAEYVYDEYVNNKEVMIGKITDSLKQHTTTCTTR